MKKHRVVKLLPVVPPKRVSLSLDPCSATLLTSKEVVPDEVDLPTPPQNLPSDKYIGGFVLLMMNAFLIRSLTVIFGYLSWGSLWPTLTRSR